MPSTPRFNLWRKWRPVVQTKEIRQSLVLEAFDAIACFIPRASIYGNGGNDCDLQTGISGVFSLTDQFTIEFWVKVMTKGTQVDTILAQFTAPSAGIDFNLTNNITLTTPGAGGGDTPTTTLPMGEWVHIAFVLNDIDESSQKLFINGQLVAMESTPGALATGIDRFRLNHDFDTHSFIGFVSECRIWDVPLSDGQIEIMYNKPKGLNTVWPDLVQYNRINEGSGVTVGATNGDLTMPVNTGNEWSTTVYPPLIWGASFVVAQWEVSLDEKTSIKFPVVPPDDVNFALVVRWVDDDDVVQRRFLWNVEGVDIAPTPADYNGEAIAADFVLEAWNVDGAAEIELTEDLTLYLGLTTLPTTDVDHTSQTAATPVFNVDLAAEFPITFPMTFNTQQNFS